jgi:hypothetical protein
MITLIGTDVHVVDKHGQERSVTCDDYETALWLASALAVLMDDSVDHA